MSVRGTCPVIACLALLLTACGSLQAPGARAHHGLPTELAAGTSDVRIIVETRDGVRPVVRAIDRAQTRVFVAAYILTDRSIVHALERGAIQGVPVYVLLDHHPYGMGRQPESVAGALRAAGVHVRWSRPGFTYSHAKYLVLDDRMAMVGTANLSASAFTRNREFIAISRRAVDVHAISNLFRTDWDRLFGIVRDPDLVVAPQRARVQIGALLSEASSTVCIYAEEVADASIERELISLARRGVRVRILLPPGATPEGAHALLVGGVQVRTLASPYVHAKVLIVDGREGFMGSENISSTSLDHNRELGILIRGKPLAIIGSFFARDWRRGSPTDRSGL